MVIAGIDPGKRGAVVVIDSTSLDVVAVLRLPYLGKHLDAHALKEFLIDHAVNFVVVERQQAMPKQGVGSTFTTGMNYGVIMGLLAGLDIPFISPAPTRWMKLALVGTPGIGKDRNVLACKRKFPRLDLTPGRIKKPHDGIADAALIAAYGATVHQ